MPLSGELSDLSLAELIEFFCNKRKSGRLTVVYPEGASYFYLQAGAVVHASFGKRNGIEAVHYALTLPNASFSFNPSFDPPEQSIDQHWTSVVLEGLRQLDEGDRHSNPVAIVNGKEKEQPTVQMESVESSNDPAEHDVRAFGVLLSQYDQQSVFTSRRWSPTAVVCAVVLVIAGVGVPWGWYTHKKAVRLNQTHIEERAQSVTSNEQVEPMASASPSPAAGTTEVSRQLRDKPDEQARINAEDAPSKRIIPSR